MLLLNTDRSDEFEIAPGDRIAQLVLIPVADAEPVEADGAGRERRGEGGFGSSGALAPAPVSG